MINELRARIVYHGAIVLFVGLLCGFAAVTELTNEQARLWRSAHLGLVVTGIWLFATASILSALVLNRRETSVLFSSLLATAYGFMTAVIIEAVIGARAVQPTGSPANMIAFAGNVLGVMGALVATLLTLGGARAARKKDAG